MQKRLLYTTAFLIVLIGLSCERRSKGLDSHLRNKVFDSVGLLTTYQRDSLAEQISDLEEKLGPQVVILLIDTLNGKKIEAYSLQVAEDLRLGRPRYRDGLLITVAVKNKEVRIEVGYGLEKIVKDEIAARIIREEIAPNFRQQKFYKGLYIAVEDIKKLIADNKDMIGQMP